MSLEYIQETETLDILLCSYFTKLKQDGAINEVFLSWLVGQHSGGEKEDKEMESLYWFYRPKQGLSKRPFLDSKDRPTGGHHVWSSEDELLGCISRVSPDCLSSRGLGENLIYFLQRELPLQSDVFWVKEHRVDLPENGH